jgi:acetyl-CoA acyltransferase
MKDAVIVSAVRTPVGKAKRGGLATVRPDEMAATVIQALLKRTSNLDPAQIEDVVIGCAFPEGEQGMNMARMIALRAGLPDSVPRRRSIAIASGVLSITHVARSKWTIETAIAVEPVLDDGADGLQIFVNPLLLRITALLHQHRSDCGKCLEKCGNREDQRVSLKPEDGTGGDLWFVRSELVSMDVDNRI